MPQIMKSPGRFYRIPGRLQSARLVWLLQYLTVLSRLWQRLQTDQASIGILPVTITNQAVLVTGITVNGEGGANTVTTGNTLQLHAVITPAGASNKSVDWSVQNETGEAEISGEGLLTAVTAGDIVAKATSTDGSNISGILKITISNELPTGNSA